MKSRSGETIKLTSIDELLGVVNEESAMEIEINRIHAFKNHPFKVLDDEKMETLHAYQSLIKENLDYDSLLVSHPHDKNQIDEIVDLIVETVMCKSDKVLIASNWYSGALVRGKFMKLDYSHVEYTTEFCMI